MKTAFVVKSLNIGGGPYVILKHALHASQQGLDVSIIATGEFSPETLDWLPEAKVLKIYSLLEATKMQWDLIILTWWETVYKISFLRAKQFCYFCQSIESRFYPDSSVHIRHKVDTTYKLIIPCITEASWIRDYLNSARTGRQVGLARNGIDKKVFNASGPALAPKRNGLMRVLVEGPLNIPFKNVSKSIALCHEAGVDEIWLLTSSEPTCEISHVDRVFSRVPLVDTAPIYRSCDLIVKLSYVEGMFGPPLEIFHCGGTAVVYDVSGHEEYIKNGENAIVIKRDDEKGVVTALSNLMHNPEKLANLKAGASVTAANWPDWQDASRVFWQEINNVCSQTHSNPIRLRIYVTLLRLLFKLRYIFSSNQNL